MKSGDKFKTKFNSKIYTAKAFFGSTGVEYKTSELAATQNGLNNDATICIKIEETNGACQIKEVIVI